MVIDDKSETRTSCDNWIDEMKMQQGKLARKDVVQTKRLSVGRVTDALKATRDKDVWKVMIAKAKEQGT